MLCQAEQLYSKKDFLLSISQASIVPNCLTVGHAGIKQ